MLRKVDKHSGIPAYLQIMNQIKSEILLGNLRAESQLPTVRELETIFDVNVNTILKALDKLKSEGILSSEQGIGYFVVRDASIDPEITDEVKSLVRSLKSKGVDLYTSLLLIEEVWKNEKL
ncbi:MAG TPA: GntR family transcriptional regulator [Pseudothermotoga sp.]|nr:GntR family transcriptional regulator [Pseudothermotoga sp.]HOK82661.1 GntR family transcriptional regulator [Pseudothermotoga sp.]HPP70422.1 GntR family transcriptional regulator [Pseudothermotoga sp.]